MITSTYAATAIYRNAITDATARYRRALHHIFKKHGSPIPVTPGCAAEMTSAWQVWLQARRDADLDLDVARNGGYLVHNSTEFSISDRADLNRMIMPHCSRVEQLEAAE